MSRQKHPPKLCKTEYAVIDKRNEDLILFSGNIHEVSNYCGTKENNILSAIRHAEVRGSHCKYVRIGFFDELEEEYKSGN